MEEMGDVTTKSSAGELRSFPVEDLKPPDCYLHSSAFLVRIQVTANDSGSSRSPFQMAVFSRQLKSCEFEEARSELVVGVTFRVL